MTDRRLLLDPVANYEPTEIGDQEYDAAVLAPVVDRDGEDALLFTRRATTSANTPAR